ncbi:MAG TPA: DUF3794 domain-containing protein [Firmicutes bacterium]|nr:DUF3794 domain-containing protein [Bacillota bacterium]
MTTSISDFRKKRVKTEFVVAEVSSSTVVRETLTVPAGKPDVASVLSAREEPVITRVTIIPGTVIIEGTLTINIMYVAAVPSQPVHFFEATVPFTHFVNIPGVYPGMIAEVFVTAQFGSYTVVNPRTVEANVILEFRVRVIREEIIEVVVELPVEVIPVPAPPVERRRITLEEAILQGEAETVATGNIAIPAGSPSAASVIHVDGVSRVVDVDVIHGKVIVDGRIDVQVLYVAALPQQPVFAVDGSIDFSGFISLPGVDPGMFAFVISQVEDIRAEVVDPRRIRVRAIVKLKAIVTFRKELEFISRIEVPTPPPLITREFLAEEIVGQAEQTSVVKATVGVPPGNPSISRVITVTARAKVKEVEVIQDKVIVDGILHITVLYVGALPDQPVFAAQDTISFLTFVQIPGAMPGMLAVADVDVQKATAEPIGPRAFDVRVVLKTWTIVTEIRTIPIVVREREVEAVQPGVALAPPVAGRVHVVKPGESLWMIAQTYGVSVEAIVRLNNIRDPERIEVGEAITIPGA